MVRAGSTTLKVVGAAGSLLVCGASAVAVITDTKPAAAPLRPPVDLSASLGAQPSAAVPVGNPLVIPPTTACAGAAAQQPKRTTAPPSPDPAIAAVVAQIRAATSTAQRQTILMQLSAAQRMQVTAYLKLVTGTRTTAPRCVPGTGASSPSVAIDPSVVTDGAPDASAVVSAVS